MKSEHLLPRHRRVGAELSGGSSPIVLCFGEVPDEYRAAREGAALFDRTRREALALSGPDAAGFLHRLLANAVRTLAVGQGNRNLLLSSKGKVLFDLDLAVGPESIHLSLPPNSAAALAKALDTYHFSEKLVVRDVSDAHAPLELCGPRAADIVARVAAIEPPRELHAHVDARFGDAPLRVTALCVAGSPGWRLDAGPASAEQLWDTLVEQGATPAGRIAHDCLRVEAGAAEYGLDVDDSIYPQEARLERAFSLDKGCYIGQEVVAKIDTYGGLNKRLVALRISHDDPLSAGTRLFRDDEGEWRDLGLVTSWAYSFVLDSGLALAYVKRRHQSAGTRFHLGDAQGSLGQATVVPLPVRPDALPPTGDFEPALDA
ncbi:MAG: aminomethyl transferase family protein [Planctomycetes bacterium]|nr:aminomethyl transferase family protein [Planctomycetota bacterium]